MKKLRRLLCAVLALLVLVSSMGAMSAFAATGDEPGGTLPGDPTGGKNYGKNIQFGQDAAREMYTMINNFRLDPANQWQLDTTETKHTLTGSEIPNSLTPDFYLEKAAMQRAAEIAVSFSHTRPNGQKYYTALGADLQFYQRTGENIAAGTNMTVEDAMVAWAEENENYAGQGHRRNMLNSNFERVGIGYAYVDGMHYWVQEFGTLTPGTDPNGFNINPEEDPPFNGSKEVQIYIQDAMTGELTPVDLSADPITIEIGTTESVPKFQVSFPSSSALSPDTTTGKVPPTTSSTPGASATAGSATGGGTTGGTVTPPTVFLNDPENPMSIECYESSDETIFTIDEADGIVLKGLKAGTAKLIVTNDKINNDDHKLEIPVTVTKPSLVGATIIVDYNHDNEDKAMDLEYSGDQKKPKVLRVYTKRGKLVDPSDYEISYDTNTDSGKENNNVIIKAKESGNYSGESKKNFMINGLSIKDAVLTLEYPEHTYTGSKLDPKVLSFKVGDKTFVVQAASGASPDASDPNTINVKEGEDFTVEYKDDINVGKATATVKGKGGLYDSGSGNYDITPASLKNAVVTPEYASAPYTGKALTPNVTVKLGDKELKKDTDYTVTYANNKDPGTATITVTGKGNYSDDPDEAATATFNITAPCEHTYDNGTVTKEPTCTDKGVMTYKCTKCGETKTEVIKAKGHTPGKAATCGEPQICTVCNKVLAAEDGKHKDANKDGKCDVCGASMSTGNGGDGGSTNISNQNSPATGSQPASKSYMIIILAALFVCFCSAFYVISVIRRKAEKKALEEGGEADVSSLGAVQELYTKYLGNHRK